MVETIDEILKGIAAQAGGMLSKKKFLKRANAALEKRANSLVTEGGREIKSLIDNIGPDLARHSALYANPTIGVEFYTPRCFVYAKDEQKDDGKTTWSCRALVNLDSRSLKVDFDSLKKRLREFANESGAANGIAVWVVPMPGNEIRSVLLAYLLHPDGSDMSCMIESGSISSCPYGPEVMRASVEKALTAGAKRFDAADFVVGQQLKHIYMKCRGPVEAVLRKHDRGSLSDVAWSDLCKAIVVEGGASEVLQEAALIMSSAPTQEAQRVAEFAIGLSEQAALVFRQQLDEVKKGYESSRRKLTDDLQKYKQSRDAMHKKSQELARENERLKREIKHAGTSSASTQSSIGEALRDLFA
jgi:hypothetical protein